MKQANYDIELDIMGCDIDGRMVENCKSQCQTGLEDVIKLKNKCVYRPENKIKINGVIISNPYGERLLDDKAVDILYVMKYQTFAPLKNLEQVLS